MLELVGAILGGVVSGAVGGWIAGAKSAQRELASSTNGTVAVDGSRSSTDDPGTTSGDSPAPVTESVPTGDDSTASIDAGSINADSTSAIDVVSADDDSQSSAADAAPSSDGLPAVAASDAESAGELVTETDDDVVAEVPLPPAALSIELEEVALGYFDLMIVNAGDGAAEDTSVEITKTGSGGYSYLPTEGDIHDLGPLHAAEQRRIGQIVRTGGKGLLAIRTTWVHPDGSTGEDEFAFD